MPCSCNKRVSRNVAPPKKPTGSISTPEVRAQNAPPTQRSAAGMSAEKRKVEKIRRDAIRKSLNK